MAPTPPDPSVNPSRGRAQPRKTTRGATARRNTTPTTGTTKDRNPDWYGFIQQEKEEVFYGVEKLMHETFDHIMPQLMQTLQTHLMERP